MTDVKQFSRDDIRRLTLKVSTLDDAQLAAVRESLFGLYEWRGGRFHREDVRRKLADLRQSGVISEIDQYAVEKAFFG